jgi:hypothetical protein
VILKFEFVCFLIVTEPMEQKPRPNFLVKRVIVVSPKDEGDVISCWDGGQQFYLQRCQTANQQYHAYVSQPLHIEDFLYVSIHFPWRNALGTHMSLFDSKEDLTSPLCSELPPPGPGDTVLSMAGSKDPFRDNDHERYITVYCEVTYK